MRAARLFGPGDLRIVDLPMPVPGPGQVLVRVMTYAPYGTDVGTYLNRHGRYVSAYPVGIGADFSGIVEACGPEVGGLASGDRVAALALDHCGACGNCASGRTNLCLDPAFAKLVRQTCCEEYTLVSARKLAVLPDGVTFEDAAMLAGIVDALNAYEQMGLDAGDNVAVVGVGAMGLGAVATAAALGLRVTALGGTGRRCDLAEALGATVLPIAHHGEDIAPRARAHRPGGFPAIIETTASDWGIAQAFAAAGERDDRAGHHQAQAMDLIASGKLSLQSTVSGRYPLDNVAEAFARLAGEEAKDIGRFLIDIGGAR